jgi:hypothetical protein
LRQQFSVRGPASCRRVGGHSIKGTKTGSSLSNSLRSCRRGGRSEDRCYPGATGIDPRRKARPTRPFEPVRLRLSTPILVQLQCKGRLYIRPAIYLSVPSRSVPSYSCQEEFFIGPSPAATCLSAVIRSSLPVSENRRSNAPTVAGSCADAFPISPQWPDNKFC